jgi:hypothetical protein
MAIPKNFQIGFEMLLRAARDERLVLAECIDSASGQRRYVICVACTGDFAGLRIPLGHLHEGNANDVYIELPAVWH